jgi:hypothetical protein
MRSSQTHEWVSIIGCISADQISTQPLLIFMGQNIQVIGHLINHFSLGILLVSSASMDDDIAIWWLEETFMPQTRPRGRQHRILLFDQQNTHLSEIF